MLPVHALVVGVGVCFFFSNKAGRTTDSCSTEAASVSGRRGSRRGDKEKLAWACVRGCVAEISPELFRQLKHICQGEHGQRVNGRVAVPLLELWLFILHNKPTQIKTQEMHQRTREQLSLLYLLVDL